jgi:hypothetical protein
MGWAAEMSIRTTWMLAGYFTPWLGSAGILVTVLLSYLSQYFN